MRYMEAKGDTGFPIEFSDWTGGRLGSRIRTEGMGLNCRARPYCVVEYAARSGWWMLDRPKTVMVRRAQ